MEGINTSKTVFEIAKFVMVVAALGLVLLSLLWQKQLNKTNCIAIIGLLALIVLSLLVILGGA